MNTCSNVIIAWLATACWLPAAHALENNLHISGTLVNEPCTLAPEDVQVELDFKSVVSKDLYLNGRTLGRPITLHLQSCDLSIGRQVSISFSGAESAQLPGLLQLAEGASAGVAIGLESQQGNALPLNQAHHMTALTEGDNVLGFLAYLQGEPEALDEHSIGLGPVAASLNFTLIYE